MHLIAGIFQIVRVLLLFAMRLLPLGIIILALYLLRRGSSGGSGRNTGGAAPKEEKTPHFRGKVMTVSYREVKDEDEPDAKDGGGKEGEKT